MVNLWTGQTSLDLVQIGYERQLQAITNEVKPMMTHNFLPFKLEKTDDEITAHAGLALFGEFVRSLNILNEIDRVFPAPGSPIGYRASEFINPLLLMLHGGGTALDDLRQIRMDTGLLKLLQIEQVPSSDAAGDWLRRQGENSRGLGGLEVIERGLLARALNMEAREGYTLDIDATQIVAEKQEAKMTYKGKIGYMPLVGHLAENGLIIGDEFREGNESPQTGNLEFIMKCERQLPKGKRLIAFRSDSAAYQASIINYCDREDAVILFGIGADLDSAVRNAIKRIPEEDWQPHGTGHIAETIHSMGDTKKAFRLIVIRRPVQMTLDGKMVEENRYKVIATNRFESPKEVERWYNQRGETSENRIKELKLGFGMERMPCGTFAANAVYFRIGVLAYNLFILFRDWSLPPEMAKHQVGTVRWRFYELAGKVVTHARSLCLKVKEWVLDLFESTRTRYRELVWT